MVIKIKLNKKTDQEIKLPIFLENSLKDLIKNEEIDEEIDFSSFKKVLIQENEENKEIIEAKTKETKEDSIETKKIEEKDLKIWENKFLEEKKEEKEKEKSNQDLKKIIQEEISKNIPISNRSGFSVLNKGAVVRQINGNNVGSGQNLIQNIQGRDTINLKTLIGRYQYGFNFQF